MLLNKITSLFTCFGSKKTDLYCSVCGCNPDSFSALPAHYIESARLHGFPYIENGEMLSIQNYMCPQCGASDRERLFAYWIDALVKDGSLSKQTRFLHFAPEPALSNKLKKLDWPFYKTADLLMQNVDFTEDIENMSFNSESFDFFICSHILEHVSSDDDAIKELYRITSIGGCGILVAPIVVGLKNTIEDPRIKDPAERWRMFGQDDHVRLYAHDDYVKKIRSHGFKVEELGEKYFGSDAYNKLGLSSSSILYVVQK